MEHIQGGTDRRFIPAASTAEAIARIFSLTGAKRQGRGEKRAIVALRDALGLDIGLAHTNAQMAAQIAEHLGITWRPDLEQKTKVNLAGLNALLAGASAAYQAGSLRALAELRPPGLDGPEWVTFQPARSKIEAVNRISQLTGSGPESLGPGCKERKSVLVNLAAAIAPGLDPRLSKTKLAAAIATALGAPWNDQCESTGETISLIGLNTLLAGAERRLGRLGVDRALLRGTPEEEGAALVAALIDAWEPILQGDGVRRVLWDGRECIEWMTSVGDTTGPNQTEWQGFYWELKARTILGAAFSPNPDPPKTKYGNTTFDYSLRYVWDLKAHTSSWIHPTTGQVEPGRGDTPLNDKEAIDACVAEQGLGFIILDGRAVADDDGSFTAWHRQRKVEAGVKTKSSNSLRSRRRKAAFEAEGIDLLFFHDLVELDAAVAAGRITVFNQGKQAPRDAGTPGPARRPKYRASMELIQPFSPAPATWSPTTPT